MTGLRADTIGDLVTRRPGAAAVLDRFGLDYCCHGERTLDEACALAGVGVAAVGEALAADVEDGADSWASLDPPALADHIVTVHHRYLQAELPLLDALAEKVLAVHGDRHPELAEVQRLVSAVRVDLEPHLLKEERVLFPAIAALLAGRRDVPFGAIDDPIRTMTVEHEQAGALLAELRTTTGGYRVPDDGCASYRSLYERLEHLELDTHVHIHKENHVLFPAALDIARS